MGPVYEKDLYFVQNFINPKSSENLKIYTETLKREEDPRPLRREGQGCGDRDTGLSQQWPRSMMW